MTRDTVMNTETSEASTREHENTTLGESTMCLIHANLRLDAFLDNQVAEEAYDFKVTCDDCAALITEDQHDCFDGLCEACFFACHFKCGACGSIVHIDDKSVEFDELCVDCGCERHSATAAAIWSDLEDVVGAWEEGELGNLRKLLMYAKHLKG